MTLLARERTLFVAVDLQGKLMDMVHEPERLLEANRRFLRLAELFERPLVLTEQYPGGLGETHPELLERFEALETPTARIEKDAFGCCGEPTFLAAVDDMLPGVAPSHRHIVVGGIEAHICVLQTVLALLESGASVFVPWDCVSSRGEEYLRWALERMQRAGAVITNHESVGFELAGNRHHPAFREFSALLKGGQPGPKGS